jgi:hypothetical protein
MKHLATKIRGEPVSNGTSEGFSSGIHGVRSARRGLPIVEEYLITILVQCGQLSLKQRESGHATSKINAKDIFNTYI